jgi:hypothetical protein
MNKALLTITPLLFLLLIFSSCEQKGIGSISDGYAPTDSLFFGFYLGMPQKDFYDICTQLNQRQVITQGPGGTTSVEHRMKDEFDSEVTMRFFPTIVDEEIFEMPVTYAYVAWAPWNKQYWSESLLEKVLDKYKEWYGDGFKMVNHPLQGKVYYKMDGKRRINLFIQDDQYVQAVFTDLKVEKRLKEEFERSKTVPQEEPQNP